MHQGKPALPAVIVLASLGLARDTELFQVNQLGKLIRAVDAISIQQMGYTLAVPPVEPMPDLLTVDTCPSMRVV